MGMDDWKTKSENDFNAEDAFWSHMENCGRICGALSFPFQNHCYWLDEDGSVLCCDRETKTWIEGRTYEEDEAMMDDVWPNGLSLAEMMRTIPGTLLDHPRFYKPRVS